MRVAYIGGDFFAPCAAAVLEAGHTLTHIFSPERWNLPVPLRMGDVARRAGVPIRRALVSADDVVLFERDGVDLILCAGYPHRLPITEQTRVPAVNLHPSPLPEGRGPAPLEWAILQGRASTAVTLHQIVERFDAGPILHQLPVPVLAADTTTSLSFRCREAAALAVGQMLGDFEGRWTDRKPQGPGTYCRVPRRPERTLNWSAPLERTDRVLRAFRPGFIYARVNEKDVIVYDAICWPEAHTFAPGAITGRSGRELLVAANGGYVYLRNTRPFWVTHLRSRAWRLARMLPGR